MSEHTHRTSSGFDGLGIAPKLLQTLDYSGFKTPTPIQVQAIPVAVEGKDIMGIAQTGTGKTLAFGVPMIQRLAAVKGRGLVILPTRELALQVDENFKKFGKGINLRTAVLIGGASMNKQLQMLRANPHVIIATPGRLIDHMEQRTLSLHDVSVLVLDEADRMLDMGFEPQIKRILQGVPAKRQTMLFSATMPPEIVNIANKYMQLPVRIEIARAGTTNDMITQELFVVKKDDKNRLLEKMLLEHPGTSLVFSRTKHGARRIMRAVRAMGHSAAEIHSDRSLAQRREALDGFKSGKYRVLVATDIAARGIDVTGISSVINYDIPDNADDYVHRIGRTGRAGHKGHAVTFATPDQGDEVRAVERVTRQRLPISKLPELPPARQLPMHPGDRAERSDRGSRFDRGGRGSHGSHGGRGGRSHGGDHGKSRGASFGDTRRSNERPDYDGPKRVGTVSVTERGAAAPPHPDRGFRERRSYGRDGGRDGKRRGRETSGIKMSDLDEFKGPTMFFGPMADDSLRPPKPKMPRDHKRR